MQFQSYFENMINDEPLRKLQIKDEVLGYSFKLAFPSYRGSHLSCIEKFVVEVNGVEITPNRIQFCLNGKKFLISQLRDLFEEYWYVLDDAEVEIYDVVPSEPAEVTVHLDYRVPYAGYSGKYFVVAGKGRKTLSV